MVVVCLTVESSHIQVLLIVVSLASLVGAVLGACDSMVEATAAVVSVVVLVVVEMVLAAVV